MINFIFITGIDLLEKAAEVAAKRVARILNLKENVQAKVVCFPRKGTLTRMVYRYSCRRTNIENILFSLELTARWLTRIPRKFPEWHVIQFHNTPAGKLGIGKRFRATKFYPLHVLSEEDCRGERKKNIKTRSPLLLLLDPDEAKNGRIVGTLEIPAYYKKLPDSLHKLMLKGRRRLIREIDRILAQKTNKPKTAEEILLEELVDPISLFDLLDLDLNLASVERIAYRTRIVGQWSTENFYFHLAEELLRIAREEVEFVRRFPQEKGKPHRLLSL